MHISKEQYKSALQAKGVIRDRTIELLGVLYDTPRFKATAPQLATMLGYDNFQPVNRLIGGIGWRMAKHLGIELPERENNSPGWWQIIAHGEERPHGFTWWLKDELKEAIDELGILKNFETAIFPEMVADPEELFEGAKKQIITNAYERNITARRLCISHHGIICAVCDFDFYVRYGELGRGFIHVHHLCELSTIGESYKVDPVNDLIPICPNCHAMIHQKTPAYTISELKAIVLANKKI
jgi:5-methylcytosine-specific restriction protein A